MKLLGHVQRYNFSYFDFLFIRHSLLCQISPPKLANVVFSSFERNIRKSDSFTSFLFLSGSSPAIGEKLPNRKEVIVLPPKSTRKPSTRLKSSNSAASSINYFDAEDNYYSGSPKRIKSKTTNGGKAISNGGKVNKTAALVEAKRIALLEKREDAIRKKMRLTVNPSPRPSWNTNESKRKEADVDEQLDRRDSTASFQYESSHSAEDDHSCMSNFTSGGDSEYSTCPSDLLQPNQRSSSFSSEPNSTSFYYSDSQQQACPPVAPTSIINNNNNNNTINNYNYSLGILGDHSDFLEAETLPDLPKDMIGDMNNEDAWVLNLFDGEAIW